MPFYARSYLAQHPQLWRTHLSVGHHPKTDDELMILDKDRTMSMHVIGKAGSGKSSGLKTMIHQDAVQGRAVIVIDPHGDLVDEAVAELPQAAISRVFTLDMRDEAFPFGANVFALAGAITTEEEKTQAIDRIMHIFDVLWDDVLKQQNLPMLLRCAVIALLDTPGSTLVDMLDFFRDDDFRAEILTHTHDQSIRNFFRFEYDRHSEVERTRRVQPLMNRLQSLFVGRSLVRNILGQRVNSLDWRTAIAEHQIILVKLPTTTMEQDARLVGTILMAQISAAIFSFADTPAQERPGVSLYVDEFQNFSTPDIRRLVTEGRKFGVRLTVAHQFLGQLPTYLQDAVKGVHTAIVFRTNSDDAKTLAPIFPARPAEPSGPAQLQPVHLNVTKHLLDAGAPDANVRMFIDMYLRPLQAHTTGRKVPIQGEFTRFDVTHALWHGAKGSFQKVEYEEDDPTPYLDNLLRDVMQERNPLLPIPWKAIAGFANCGRGFYNALGNRKLATDLTAGVQFPAYLANQTARGFVWLRAPHSEYEQLLHCIFCLRMTMYYLAEHPVLKGGAATSKVVMLDYAQLLIQLPVRMALVKSGDDVGMIVTNDTPRPLTGEALDARRFFIREHTRQRYCHPREQIQRLIDATTPPDAATLGQWNIKRSEKVESAHGTNQANNQPASN